MAAAVATCKSARIRMIMNPITVTSKAMVIMITAMGTANKP